MKASMHVCMLVLAVSASAARTKLRAPASGAAPEVDSFQDEITDQADPEFKKVAGGSDCITLQQFQKMMEQEIDSHTDRKVGTTPARLTSEDKANLKALLKLHGEAMFANADKNGDGCINEEEWNGPSGGESRIEGGDTSFKGPTDTKMEFQLMDINADGRVSRQEAYTYVHDYLDESDLNSDKMKKLFEDADKDKDNYITEKEFTDAGAAHEGDGNYKFWLSPRRTNLRHSLKMFVNAHKHGVA
eukprot:gnl/TRDRNA2_/TRDRNA2_179634_c0_seq1.p1 gnl/TRDRNA2_/TRDRNA2_179634_c0~~gnl/TRDRNA2_/TRDRNA2_179634_c0_seq1.p1  ORF type:complete len:245 (-),score=70.34 gnl/TRDRNA2_/TRDRNA2_179634_c0_seq1:83-817(-)